jgi:CO dehydrogenase maturation factor
MKIAFVGKGGSGKTTLSSLFSRYLASQNLPVLAIDADINQHMATGLGATPEQAKAIPPLGLEMDRVKDYLRGSNSRITSTAAMAKTTPPGHGSRLLHVAEPNPIYDHFVREIDGVRFLATGPFSEDDMGVKCYHSKIGAVELMLSHMIDREGEYVVVDMTAGADSFASGMFTKFDLTFLVAEPTLKGLGVYEQYKHYARDYDVQLRVIGNKVESEDDVEFLRQHVGGDLWATFGRSQYVRGMEKGHHVPLTELEPENLKVLERMKAAIDATPKDWAKFYHHTVEFHERNALAWANAAAGEDLRRQIDPEFDLAKAVQQAA